MGQLFYVLSHIQKLSATWFWAPVACFGQEFESFKRVTEVPKLMT